MLHMMLIDLGSVSQTDLTVFILVALTLACVIVM